jgi:hypothetical protein
VFFSNFVLEYINKVQKNQKGLELNRIHQLLVYADDVKTLGGNTNPIAKTTEFCYRLVRRLV